MSAMYFLRLFGSVTVSGPSGPVTGSAVQQRAMALLAVLAAAQRQGCTRDKIIGVLWPERDTAGARHGLADVVYQIRKALGESAIIVSGETLLLNDRVIASDVGAFVDALEIGDFEEVVERYAGPFAEGLFSAGTPGFEPWVEGQRQRFGDDYASALESLVTTSEAHGDHVTATKWWKRLQAHDPYNSRFVLGLIGALVASGDPANARLALAEHERLLREDLDLEPTAELRQRAEELLEPQATRSEPVQARVTPPPIPNPVATAIPPPTEELADPSERRSPTTVSPQATLDGSRPRRRRALSPIGVATIAIAIAAGSYVTARALGIGPFASSTSRGELESPIGVVLADFVPIGVDTNFADMVTELLRIDLVQSPILHTLSRAQVRRALERMQRDPGRLADEAAIELAEREGLAAVIGGEVRGIGTSYLLLVTLTTVADSVLLVAEREEARDSFDLIAAAERVSRRIRERTGEARRSVRAGDGLVRVTTGSIEALRSYTAAVRVTPKDADWTSQIHLLEEAVAVDSGFALAYLQLAGQLTSIGRETESRAMSERAFRSRERLPLYERLAVEGWHYMDRGDWHAAERAFERMFKFNPGTCAGDFPELLLRQRRFAETEQLSLRQIDGGCRGLVAGWNVVEAQVARGRFAPAESVLTRMGPSPTASELRAKMLLAKRDWDAAIAFLAADSISRNLGWSRGGPKTRFQVSPTALVKLVRGRVSEAGREGLRGTFEWALYELRYRGDTLSASRELDAWLVHVGWDSLRATERIEAARTPGIPSSMWKLILLLAELGRISEARNLLHEWETRQPADPMLREFRDYCEGAIALTEGRLDSAFARFLRASTVQFASAASHVQNRGLVEAARALDRMGQADSAIGLYEKALARPSLGYDALLYEVSWYPLVLRRLGELHESLRHRSAAIDYYDRFIDLWKDADPDLQPQVRHAQEARARLAGGLQ